MSDQSIYVGITAGPEGPLAFGTYRYPEQIDQKMGLNAFALKSSDKYGPVDFAGSFIFIYSLVGTGEIVAANGPYTSSEIAEQAASAFEAVTSNLVTSVIPFIQNR